MMATVSLAGRGHNVSETEDGAANEPTFESRRCLKISLHPQQGDRMPILVQAQLSMNRESRYRGSGLIQKTTHTPRSARKPSRKGQTSAGHFVSKPIVSCTQPDTGGPFNEVSSR